jgi:F-type H+-transporting ATPase subunit gamma
LLRRPKGTEKRVALIVITSNRGLCGAFNSNLIREARRRIEELEGRGSAVELHLIGRKGTVFFRFTKREAASQRIDVGDKPTTAQAAEIIAPLRQRFENGELDAVDVVFAKFNSAVSTPPTTLRILPVLPPADAKKTTGPKTDYILRPSADVILEQLLPLYVQNQLFRALVETAAAEHGARRTAMKNATDSAGDMLDLLRRTYNRARQAQITQELAEIVGGAEALQG